MLANYSLVLDFLVIINLLVGNEGPERIQSPHNGKVVNFALRGYNWMPSAHRP